MRLLIAAAVVTSSMALSTPSMAANVVEVAKSAGTFNTLLAAAEAAGLAETLATTSPITVFAPTDAAFAALPAGTVDDLLKPENKDKLIGILSYHVLGSKVMAVDVPTTATEVQTLKTAGDGMISVVKTATGVTVDGATVVTADVAADNGVIHVIDKVLLPTD